jgi:DHA1 family tetracycline resistance protein-like MFS transporter
MNNTSKSSMILLTLFIIIFIDMLGIGILIPVIPLIILPASKFYVLPITWDTRTCLIFAGWLLALYPIMQFIATPIIGQLSDIYGRKKILIISLFGTCLSYLIFIYAIYTKNNYLMIFSRIIDGITGGNISVSQAIIGDISVKNNKSMAKNFAIVGMALGLGFILGPFIGGVLSNPNNMSWFSATTPFIFAAFISFISCSLVILILPETLNVRSNIQSLNLFKAVFNIKYALSNVNLNKIFPVIFLFNAGFAFFTTFFGIILAHHFNFNQSQIGNFFAYFGLMTVLSQGMIVRRISGKLADISVLKISIIATGLFLLLFPLVPAQHSYYLYFIPPFLALFIAITKSFSMALITRITHDDKRGVVMGVNSSVNALANSLPPIVAGYLAATGAMLPVIIGGIIIIAGGILFNLFKHN